MIKTKKYLMLSLAMLFILAFAFTITNNLNKTSAFSYPVNTTDKQVIRYISVGDDLSGKEIFIDVDKCPSVSNGINIVYSSSYRFQLMYDELNIQGYFQEVDGSPQGLNEAIHLIKTEYEPGTIIKYILPADFGEVIHSSMGGSILEDYIYYYIDNPDYIEPVEEAEEPKIDIDKIKDFLKTDIGFGVSIGTLVIGFIVLRLIFKR